MQYLLVEGFCLDHEQLHQVTFHLFLVIGKISVVTMMPILGVIIMMISVIILSKRENMSEFNSSLENIESIDKIK